VVVPTGLEGDLQAPSQQNRQRGSQESCGGWQAGWPGAPHPPPPVRATGTPINPALSKNISNVGVHGTQPALARPRREGLPDTNPAAHPTPISPTGPSRQRSISPPPSLRESLIRPGPPPLLSPLQLFVGHHDKHSTPTPFGGVGVLLFLAPGPARGLRPPSEGVASALARPLACQVARWVHPSRPRLAASPSDEGRGGRYHRGPSCVPTEMTRRVIAGTRPAQPLSRREGSPHANPRQRIPPHVRAPRAGSPVTWQPPRGTGSTPTGPSRQRSIPPPPSLCGSHDPAPAPHLLPHRCRLFAGLSSDSLKPAPKGAGSVSWPGGDVVVGVAAGRRSVDAAPLTGTAACGRLHDARRWQVQGATTGGAVTDVIIIGGGIAGMATACRLQARGLSTVVLEAHVAAGGCAGYFQESGFAFDVGATTLVDFEPGGVGGSSWRRSGRRTWRRSCWRGTWRGCRIGR